MRRARLLPPITAVMLGGCGALLASEDSPPGSNAASDAAAIDGQLGADGFGGVSGEVLLEDGGSTPVPVIDSAPPPSPQDSAVCLSSGSPCSADAGCCAPMFCSPATDRCTLLMQACSLEGQCAKTIDRCCSGMGEEDTNACQFGSPIRCF